MGNIANAKSQEHAPLGWSHSYSVCQSYQGQDPEEVKGHLKSSEGKVWKPYKHNIQEFKFLTDREMMVDPFEYKTLFCGKDQIPAIWGYFSQVVKKT